MKLLILERLVEAAAVEDVRTVYGPLGSGPPLNWSFAGVCPLCCWLVLPNLCVDDPPGFTLSPPLSTLVLVKDCDISFLFYSVELFKFEPSY